MILYLSDLLNCVIGMIREDQLRIWNQKLFQVIFLKFCEAKLKKKTLITLKPLKIVFKNYL